MLIKPIRYCLVVFATLICIVLIFLGVAGVKSYRPQGVEILYSSDTAPSYSVDSLTVTTWNVGYANMDATADFFMDGGKMVRNKRVQVEENILYIAKTLQYTGSDIFLLQEVDIDARRSYHINQLGVIHRYLVDYQHFFALNFNTFFVPIPIFEPIGQVKSGVSVLSRWQPKSVERWSYPVTLPIPNRWFDLQRCFMVCRFSLVNEKELVVINTHNSAFDKRNRRSKEMNFLQQFLTDEYEKGNYVIAGGDWNQTPPQYSATAGTPQYTPIPVSADFLPADWTFAYDAQHPSVRFANQPYNEETSLVSIVDFFVLSPNLTVKSVTTLPFHFASSDHEPVNISIGINE
ncbi:endonuclease [Bacteroidia bacterium]|nr:endonuclease [Bacteroidia bacterium]